MDQHHSADNSIEIPLRVEMILRGSEKDYRDLQKARRSKAGTQEYIAAELLRNSNRRLVQAMDQVQLPKRLYIPPPPSGT